MIRKDKHYEAPATEAYSIASEGIICSTRGGTDSGNTEDDDI